MLYFSDRPERVVGDVTTKHAVDRHGAVDADYQAWLVAC